MLATQQLLEAAKRQPEKRFVFASSSSVYGQAERCPTPEDVVPRPFSPYGCTKLAAEQLCRLYHDNYGVQTVCLRYFSVYGPRQRPDMAFPIFCRGVLRDEPVRVFGDGAQTRDFTFVGDVVTATRAAADAPVAAAGSTTSAAARRSASTRRIGIIERARRAAAARRAGRPASGATCAAPAPTRRGRAASSASSRPWTSRPGSRCSSTGRRG